MKLFLRYVDDIVRTVRGEPSCLLDAANSVHPNLQFTLEETNSEGSLPFLDLNINVSQGRRVTCSWYQKPTDTGTILNYRSCSPTQSKRSVIQGTVHGPQRWLQTPSARSSRVRSSPWIVRGACKFNHQRMGSP